MTSCWVRALPLAELAPGTARVFKAEGCQVAIFRTPEGEVLERLLWRPVSQSSGLITPCTPLPKTCV